MTVANVGVVIIVFRPRDFINVRVLLNMKCTLKVVIRGNIIGLLKGDTRSLDFI